MKVVGFLDRRSHTLFVLALALATGASVAIHSRGRGRRDEGSTPGPPWLTARSVPRRRIAGHVYAGRAAAHAVVHLRADVADASLWPGLNVATASDGSFDFGSLPTGAYQLIAVQDGLVSRIVHVRTDGRARNEMLDGDDVELYLERCTMRTVDVRGPLNAPVERANLLRGGVWTARTSQDGTAVVCALPGEELVARATGLASGWDDLGIEGSDGYIVRLGDRIELSGRVVSRSGVPVPGALVQPTTAAECERIGSNAWAEALDAAVTGEDGTFHVAVHSPPPPGAATARFCVRIGDRVWDPDVIRGDASDAALVLRAVGPGRLLEPSSEVVAVVRGRVSCGGAPIADALVVHIGDPFVSQDRTRTRRDGRFTLMLGSFGAREIEIWMSSPEADRLVVEIGSRPVVVGRDYGVCRVWAE